jgi:DNA-binding transcriptional ArsR family regulator
MLNHQDPLDLAFQALADGTRRTMLARLAKGPVSVSALAEPLAISLPAVMQHLSVLEHAGLVSSDKTGRVRTCRIEPAGLTLAEQWLSQRRQEWEQRFDRLDDYLKTLNPEGEGNGT